MAPRDKAGFTLIELMVVVAIIAVLITYAVPGINRSVADRRAATAVSEIVRIGNRARAAAQSGKPAHLVVIRESVNGQSLVQLLRGTTGACALQNWTAADALCPPPEAGRAPGVAEPCPEFLNLGQGDWLHLPHEIRVRLVPQGSDSNLPALLQNGGGNTVSVCYERNGSTFWSVNPLGPTMTFSDLNQANAAGGGFLFTVAAVNQVQNLVVGVPRVLSFPLGSAPRRVR